MTGLSTEERRLLSALVRHPEETDRRLGGMSGLDQLRATYIRTRMQKLRIFRFLRVPAFSRLGADIFWAGILETGTGDEGRVSYERLRRVLGGMPGIFWALAEGGKAVVLGIYRSPAEAAADAARLEKVQGVELRGSVEMPIAALENGPFLDFSNVLERPTGASVAVPEERPPGMAAGFRPLLGFEREALQALVEFPDDGHTALARRLGITVKVFMERTAEIRSGRLFRTVAVPDVRLLGLGTLAVWMAGGARPGAGAAAPEAPAPAVDAAAGERDDGPLPDSDQGDLLPLDTGMVPEQDSVLPEGLPAGLRDDWVEDPAGDERKGRARKLPAPGGKDEAGRSPAAADGKAGPGKAPAASDGIDGPVRALQGNVDPAGKATPESDALRMPWQEASLMRQGRPRFDGPRPREAGPTGAKRGIEALPKDIARTLIGRPSRETVEQAKAELERRRIWDIDLDRILQDAGVVPAKRAAPAAPPLPPVWIRLATEVRPALPGEGSRGSVTVQGERRDMSGSGAAAGEGAGRPPAGLAIMLPVKRKRGRPPKVRPAPVETGTDHPDGTAAAVLADGNPEPFAPVVKRKRGRPRKTPANGNVAMVMERFLVRVAETGGGREGAGTGSTSLPVFLDALEAGRRFALGLFRERGDAERADEQVRRDAGPELGMHLMQAARLEILKPLDLGAVTGRILELDRALSGRGGS